MMGVGCTTINPVTEVDYYEEVENTNNLNSLCNNETMCMQMPDNFLSSNDIPQINSIPDHEFRRQSLIVNKVRNGLFAEKIQKETKGVNI